MNDEHSECIPCVCYGIWLYRGNISFTDISLSSGSVACAAYINYIVKTP